MRGAVRSTLRHAKVARHRLRLAPLGTAAEIPPPRHARGKAWVTLAQALNVFAACRCHSNFLDLLSQLTTVGDVSKATFDDRIENRDPFQHVVVFVDRQTVRHCAAPSNVSRATGAQGGETRANTGWLQGSIAATGSLYLEPKFIHSAGYAGHIEDVVVDVAARGTRGEWVSLISPHRPPVCRGRPYCRVVSGQQPGLPPCCDAGKGLGKRIVELLKEMAFAAGCYKVILDCKASNVAFYQKCGFTLGHSTVCMAHYF